MKAFNFYTPKTLTEALDLLNQCKGRATVIAGGTDVVIELTERQRDTDCVININKLNELRYCKVEDGKVKIGALTTFTELENDPYIRENVKGLHSCAVHVGSPQIRNLGTIGGNVVNCSVAGDSPTTFMALDATVVLQSKAGKREMKLTDFYANCKKTQIADDELMTEIYFDAPAKGVATATMKLGKRKALVIVVVGLAVLVEKDDAGNISRAQVVIGGVSPKPARLPKVEEYLAGKPVSKATFAPCADLLSDAVREMIPTRASMPYKKEGVKGVSDKTFGRILADFGLQEGGR
ncbi:MAG: xanthine dehydrogenase family protein subunit M [Clostridiales bacterium]